LREDHAAERGEPEKPPVSRSAERIAHPYRDWAKQAASQAERPRPEPSAAATPLGEGRPKPRKWYSLYDKVYGLKNLQAAWERVQANGGAAGCDGQTVAHFAAHAEANLQALHEQLRTKQYRPRPVKRVDIPKAGGGKRPLGIPCVRDRIVQQAVLQVLQPIFEPLFSRRSHGFRPERGTRTALEVVDRALEHGYEWVVDADIERFFETVDHELLNRQLNAVIADGSVLNLIQAFLKSGVLVGGSEIAATEVGTPQGGPLSPLLANVYLHPLDQALEAEGFGLVRYADDFVIFAKTRERADEARGVVEATLTALRLRLHPEKTRVVRLDSGFDFLGFHYFRDGQGRLQKKVSAKALRRFREAIRKRTRRHAGQKRPTANRCTIARLRENARVPRMLAQVNEFLRGWHGYFRRARTTYRDYLNDFDRIVRQRLRNAISGRFAKGRWNQILSNEVLDAVGLLCLAQRQRLCDLGPLTPPTSGYAGGSRVR
jgi:RNA-directed DNA polymerase